MYLLDNLNPRPDVLFDVIRGHVFYSYNQHDIFRRHPSRYDTDNTLENLTVKAATGEKQWPVSTAFHELVDSSGNQRKTPYSQPSPHRLS
ncbi:hypothetical protein C0Z64_20555 [Salmonella enterica]|nr:hypothetical protein [Salmonella enterica]EBD4046092.1 hypothetical protein [Salmonella enterica]EEK9386273.1 hypothetical protein [Salmonella enterica]